MSNATILPTMAPEKALQGKLMSEAALERRLKKQLTASFASDAYWDFMGVAGGLYFVFVPLEKKLRQLARRYRNKPDVFWESFRRLVQKRCSTDREYVQKLRWFLRFCARLRVHFQEPNPAESGSPRLTKYQRRKKAEMLESVRFFLPLPGRVPSGGDGTRIAKILTELGKAGPGRKTDPDSKKVIALYENGKHGYGTLAKAVWPELWQEAEASDEKSDKKRLLKDRARQIIRRYKLSLS